MTWLVADLPRALTIGQVSCNSYLPSKKNYSSWMSRQDSSFILDIWADPGFSGGGFGLMSAKGVPS